MKIALVAATGNIGRQIARQAIANGHQVTALVRRDTALPPELEGARIAVALDDHPTLVAAIRGHDVLASAYGPGNASVDNIPAVTKALVSAAREAGIKRVVVVGGAGSLEIAPGQQLVDIPDFPAAYKPQALAHREALQIWQRADDLNWTFFAPPAEIGPGAAQGNVRVQAKALLTDAQGHSRIHYPDYAAAFVAEIERPRFVRQIVTAAY